MAHFELIERVKPRRRMKQPTKDYIRAELKLAEAEIERLQAELEHARQPWLKRLLRKNTNG